MVFETAKSSMSVVSNTLTTLIHDLTKLRVATRVGKGSQSILNNVGKLVKKVPLAGNVVAYVFRQTGKGFVIVTTTADNLVNNAGHVVRDVITGANDVTVLTVDTVNPFKGKKSMKKRSSIKKRSSMKKRSYMKSRKNRTHKNKTRKNK